MPFTGLLCLCTRSLTGEDDGAEALLREAKLLPGKGGRAGGSQNHYAGAQGDTASRANVEGQISHPGYSRREREGGGLDTHKRRAMMHTHTHNTTLYTNTQQVGYNTHTYAHTHIHTYTHTHNTT